MIRRGSAAGVIAAALTLGVPGTAGAVGIAPVAAKVCTSHSLHLAGPHRAKVGDGVTLRVTDRRGHPARGARIRALGVDGSLKVDEGGRVTIQFAAPKIYRVVAYRGAQCSDVFTVDVHR
jgi:hypothetical protein